MSNCVLIPLISICFVLDLFFFIETFFFDIIPQFFVDREFNFIIFSCFSSMG